MDSKLIKRIEKEFKKMCENTKCRDCKYKNVECRIAFTLDNADKIKKELTEEENRLLFEMARKVSEEQGIYCDEKECKDCPYSTLYRCNGEYFNMDCRVIYLISKLLENLKYFNEIKEKCEKECE